MNTKTKTTYFLSFAVPAEAARLVYDSHEQLCELERDHAVKLFPCDDYMQRRWAQDGQYPLWYVYGVETTDSAERCRYLMQYQADRIRCSTVYPILFNEDLPVVATTVIDCQHDWCWSERHNAFICLECHTVDHAE